MGDQNPIVDAGTAVNSVGSTAARAAYRSAGGWIRWVICGLLLFGVTKNYMDRWVISALKTTLQHDLGWNDIDYSNLIFGFQAAYAVGMLVVGGIIDRLGSRLGYAAVMVFWSLASMAHAFCSSFSSFLAARVALGLLDYWRARILLAHPVARVLPRTGETPAMFESRTCVHKERSAATGG